MNLTSKKVLKKLQLYQKFMKDSLVLTSKIFKGIEEKGSYELYIRKRKFENRLNFYEVDGRIGNMMEYSNSAMNSKSKISSKRST